MDAKLTEAGLDVSEYDSRRGCYPLHLEKDDIAKHAELLKMLVRRAYEMKHK
jgi:hypothetical protein